MNAFHNAADPDLRRAGQPDERERTLNSMLRCLLASGRCRLVAVIQAGEPFEVALLMVGAVVCDAERHRGVKSPVALDA
jgi:hypothetical protein